MYYLQVFILVNRWNGIPNSPNKTQVRTKLSSPYQKTVQGLNWAFHNLIVGMLNLYVRSLLNVYDVGLWHFINLNNAINIKYETENLTLGITSNFTDRGAPQLFTTILFLGVWIVMTKLSYQNIISMKDICLYGIANDWRTFKILILKRREQKINWTLTSIHYGDLCSFIGVRLL